MMEEKIIHFVSFILYVSYDIISTVVMTAREKRLVHPVYVQDAVRRWISSK